MDQYKIEKNIPMPEGPRGCIAKYPFKTMEVGDSFLVTDQDDAKAIISTAAYYSKRNKQKFKFATRKVKEGRRVWRIE